MRAVDLWPTVPELLAGNNYCVLATSDVDGTPWATPVFFAARDDRELFWVSAPDSRHSRNIAARAGIAITVFDTSAPVGGAEALFLEADAAAAGPDSSADALRVLKDKLQVRQALELADLVPTGPLQVYRAAVRRHFVLVRGGDERFENVVDHRVEVHPS